MIAINKLARGLLIPAVLLGTASAFGATECNDFKAVGEGELRKFFIKVYDAKLATPSGRYIDNRSLCLQIDYSVAITDAQFLKATSKQFSHLGVSDAQKADWLAALKPLMPSVKKGDQIVLYVDKDGQGTLYHNRIKTGALASPQLTDSFANIWLSPKSSEQRLRRALVSRS